MWLVVHCFICNNVILITYIFYFKKIDRILGLNDLLKMVKESNYFLGHFSFIFRSHWF
jgi:hypothetical protein